MAGTLDLAQAFGSGGLTTNYTPGISGSPYPADLYGDGSTAQPDDGGAASTPVYTDPYAAYGGTARYNQLRADYTNQSNQTNQSILDRIGAEGTKYGSGIQDFVENLGAGQGKINAKSVQNELSKRQGSAGVLDMIGRGVRSGGVMLSNKNAASSSGADAIARAYADIGRREQTGVNNQFAQGNNAIAADQAALDLQRSQGVRHLGEDKTTVINGIVTDAQNALAALNQAAASASLPDRVDIEARKQEVRNQAMAKLQEYDQALTSGLANIHPSDVLENRAKAAALNTAGTAADNVFSFNTAVPQQLQDTGPFTSDLPLFTFNRKNQQAGI